MLTSSSLQVAVRNSVQIDLEAPHDLVALLAARGAAHPAEAANPGLSVRQAQRIELPVDTPPADYDPQGDQRHHEQFARATERAAPPSDRRRGN